MTAKIMILNNTVVLTDRQTKGAPLYSTPLAGNFMYRVHRYAFKRGIEVVNEIYFRFTKGGKR